MRLSMEVNVSRMITQLLRSRLVGLVSLVLIMALAVGLVGVGTDHGVAKKKSKQPELTFSLVPSEVAETNDCLEAAQATAKVFLLDQAEKLQLSATGLPQNVPFTVFVIQVPNAPFGAVWYQGDLISDNKGNAKVSYVGRFSVESFINAPGAADPVVLHAGDAEAGTDTNGAIHTFHVGVWFDDPADAAAAGCPDTVTPFNDVHEAGIQALSTRNAGADAGDGPLRDVG
jgi:hypothetical protein